VHESFEVLGLSEDATPRQVKSAWRRLAREFHPDLNPARDAAERFREIAEAFEAALAAARHPRPTSRRFGWGVIGVDVRVSVRPLCDDDWR